MTEQTNVLKQTENLGNIKGVLTEKNLEIVTDSKTKQPTAIRGSIVVSTANQECNNEHRIEIYCTARTKSGKENPLYKNMNTLMTDYIDKARAVQLNCEPDIVFCKVDLRNNDYVTKQGALVNDTRINLQSIRRVNVPPEEFEAICNLEGYIRNYTPEIKNEEETGRLVVDFVGVGYSGELTPFKLIVPADLADGFESIYSVGDTTTFLVDFVNYKVEPKNNTQTGFGREGRNRAVSSMGYTVKELQIYHGDDPYEEGIDSEAIQEGEKERQIKLEQMVKNHSSKNNSKTNNQIPSKELPF